MGDEYKTVRAAAVQAASVFLDREASIDKACTLIREAGSHGAHLIVFPESFVPGHPLWFHWHPAPSSFAKTMDVELFKNAVEIPGPDVDRLQQAAADAGAYVVVGVCEKTPGTIGTLYNSQIFLGPDGSLLGRRQKLVPTVFERLVHAMGQGDNVSAFATDFGPASALICGENSNPLAIFALTAQYPRVHSMSWPPHLTADTALRNRVMIDSQAFAQATKAYVVSACGTLDDATVAKLQMAPEDATRVRGADFCGGSVIVAPDSRVIAGPLGSEESILYADLDLELGIRMKFDHDFAGHYNRFDVFQLHVQATSTRMLEVSRDYEPPGLGDGASGNVLGPSTPLAGLPKPQPSDIDEEM